jgi:hypothetical protein
MHAVTYKTARCHGTFLAGLEALTLATTAIAWRAKRAPG